MSSYHRSPMIDMMDELRSSSPSYESADIGTSLIPPLEIVRVNRESTRREQSSDTDMEQEMKENDQQKTVKREGEKTKQSDSDTEEAMEISAPSAASSWIDPFPEKLNQSLVHCPESVNGCEWIGELGRGNGNLKKHYRNCGFHKISCSFCEKSLLSKDIENHLDSECSKNLLECKDCGKEILACERENHARDECSSRRMTCIHCGEEMSAMELVSHQQSIADEDLRHSDGSPSASSAPTPSSSASSSDDSTPCVRCQVCSTGCKDANGRRTVYRIDQRESHMKKCPLRMVECLLCSDSHPVSASKIVEHQLSVKMAMVPYTPHPIDDDSFVVAIPPTSADEPRPFFREPDENSQNPHHHRFNKFYLSAYHEHPLKFLERPPRCEPYKSDCYTFPCHICDFAGASTMYHCTHRGCRFDLHPRCYIPGDPDVPPIPMSYTLIPEGARIWRQEHPSCPMVWTKGWSFNCDKCTMLRCPRHEWRFACTKHNIDLHRGCVTEKY